MNKLLGIKSSVIGNERHPRSAPSSTSPTGRPGPCSARSTTRREGSSATTPSSGRFARAADRRGVEIHPYTEVTGFERSNGRVTAVETTRGRIECGQVVSATAGWSTLVAGLAGVRLPITTHILQAFVTEPLKPFLDVIIVSSQLHVYVSQTDRGEFLIGSEIEPYTTYKGTGTLSFLETCSRHTLELFPQLERTKVLRTWTGLCDLSPDYSPILGRTELDNFHVSAGLGDVRVQGRADRRGYARRARRHRQDARPDRAVRARALPHGHARLGARCGGREPLEQGDR